MWSSKGSRNVLLSILAVTLAVTGYVGAGGPMPAPFVGDTGAGGRQGEVPAPAAGDAAAKKILGSGGSWVTPASLGIGTGDVVGPSSSYDNQIPRFDSTTGKIIQASYMYYDDYGDLFLYSHTAGMTGTLQFGGTDGSGPEKTYFVLSPRIVDATLGSEDASLEITAMKAGAWVGLFGYAASVFSDGPYIPCGSLQLGYASGLVDGKLSLYSEQGATDYTWSMLPNAAMTASFTESMAAALPGGLAFDKVDATGAHSWDTNTYLIAEADTLATVTARGETATANMILPASGKLKWISGVFSTTLAAGTNTQDNVFVWPADDGTSGQSLVTNGSGTMSWATPAAGSVAATDITFTDGDKMVGTTTSAVDSYTKLLMHMEGTDQVFDDSSVSAKSTSAVGGDATQTAAQKHFGSKSAYFDGSGDYIQYADDADWTFGTGNFTVDFWVRFNSTTGTVYALVTHGDVSTSTNGWWIARHSGGFMWCGLGTGVYDIAAGSDGWSADTWHHIALVRNGANLTLYGDGAVLGTSTPGAYDVAAANVLRIGSAAAGPNFDFAGYIDELRISKGIARWTADFSASLPSAPYAGTYAVQEFTNTAAGRALLDDADAAAQRATLGVTLAAVTALGETCNADLILPASGKLKWISGAFSTTLAAGTNTQDNVFVWPADDGSANQFLQTDGAGTCTWATALTAEADTLATVTARGASTAQNLALSGRIDLDGATNSKTFQQTNTTDIDGGPVSINLLEVTAALTDTTDDNLTGAVAAFVCNNTIDAGGVDALFGLKVYTGAEPTWGIAGAGDVGIEGDLEVQGKVGGAAFNGAIEFGVDGGGSAVAAGWYWATPSAAIYNGYMDGDWQMTAGDTATPESGTANVQVYRTTFAAWPTGESTLCMDYTMTASSVATGTIAASGETVITSGDRYLLRVVSATQKGLHLLVPTVRR